MGEHCDRKRERQQTTCILCTFLLVGLLILLLILYFSLFKPKDPTVQIPTMQLLSYSTVGAAGAGTALSASSAASLSLNLQVSMYNPNRGDFIIQEDSTACLYYENQQVGFTPIPAGTIPAQSFSTASVRISSSSAIPLIPDASGGSYISGSSGTVDNVMPTATVLPIATSVTIVGHVSTAGMFSHDSRVVSKCKVALSLGAPRAYIQSYSCQSSVALDD